MPGFWAKTRWVTIFNGTVDTDEAVELNTLAVTEGVDVLVGVSWSVAAAAFTGIIEVQDPLTSTWNVLNDTGSSSLLAIDHTLGADGCRIAGTNRIGDYPVIPPGTRWHHTGGLSADNQTSLLIATPGGG